jgi:hypothetical protein
MLIFMITNSETKTESDVTDGVDATIDGGVPDVDQITKLWHHGAVNHPYGEPETGVRNDQMVHTRCQRYLKELEESLVNSFRKCPSGGTSIRQIPMMISPNKAANHRPIRCPKGPKRFVPIRYEMLAGRNVTPCFHRSAPIVSIIQMGREGSNMAMPMLANVIAPWNVTIDI